MTTNPMDMCQCGWWYCHHRWAGLPKKNERVCDTFTLKSTHTEYLAKRERHRKRMNQVHFAQIAAVLVLIVVSVFRAFRP